MSFFKDLIINKSFKIKPIKIDKTIDSFNILILMFSKFLRSLLIMKFLKSIRF